MAGEYQGQWNSSCIDVTITLFLDSQEIVELRQKTAHTSLTSNDNFHKEMTTEADIGTEHRRTNWRRHRR